jgi:hypothetical protein
VQAEASAEDLVVAVVAGLVVADAVVSAVVAVVDRAVDVQQTVMPARTSKVMISSRRLYSSTALPKL